MSYLLDAAHDAAPLIALLLLIVVVHLAARLGAGLTSALDVIRR